MDKYNLLSGDEIVAKGATKIEVTLPEIGLKDVIPNGSWLEQKQIQAALEARKQLVEVQRIEKSGVLTHAEWREDLKLAEVTQQAGGYWQFLGHHRDGRLYLRPEETLFLIEVNCLLLRYNEVIVSLQQAYSLLLSDDISIIQYKVYASLSRLGYKVFKHFSSNKKSNTKDTEKENSDMVLLDTTTSDNSENDINLSGDVEIKEPSTYNVGEKNCDAESEGNAMDTEKSNLTENESCASINKISQQSAMVVEGINEIVDSKELENINKSAGGSKTEQNAMVVEENSSSDDNKTRSEVEESPVQITDNNSLSNQPQQMIECGSSISMTVDNDSGSSSQPSIRPQQQVQDEPGPSNTITNIDPLTKYSQWKLEKLKKRQSSPVLDIHKCFKDCPDILENQVITVNTPKEEYLPKNIFINNLHYVINIENVRTKNVVRPASTDSTYSLSDEVNGAHIRRVTNSAVQIHTPSQSQSQPQQNSVFPPFFPHFRPNMPYRNFNYWRPRHHNMSYFQFNLFFQRPYMANFQPRFQFYPRMHMPMFPRHFCPPMDFTVNNEFGSVPNDSRKRSKNRTKTMHLENLRNLAQRLKNLVTSGTNRAQNIEAIQSLIHTYNTRFRTRFRLSEEYEIVSDETIVDTITLDDDDNETKAKKPRLDEQHDLFIENLDKIRQTALKLKKLEAEHKSSARHRRALSAVIKTFNKNFDADIYMTDTYDVLDRRHINLDSSSDSDCVIEEVPIVKSGKKLRNPFNILKRLSEKQASPTSPSTSRQEFPESPIVLNALDSHEVLQKCFQGPWLPDDHDFGRPEVVSRDTMTARLIETKKEEFLFDFLKDQSDKFNNWADVKIAFLESIEETNAILQTGAMLENNVDIKSLVKPEDCTDMETVLKKLTIIRGNKNVRDASILTIDYDVYNRDVKKFRKANKPKPHFRVVCIDESSTRISGIDIATLHANVEDNVAVLFAIVGVSSISFVQLNPTESPVYLPSNDLG